MPDHVAARVACMIHRSRNLGFVALLSSAALFSSCALLSSCGGTETHASTAPPVAMRAPSPSELRTPDAFASIGDRAERSRAIFMEATRVMFHPRCSNCHPNGDSPAQGDSGQLHDPPVRRGPEDHGIPGLMCTSCHQDKNLELARVPGAPKWALAPIVMAWVGRTPHALCEQVKDPARNGGKSLKQIVDHAAHDSLVAWGWAPGSGRAPAPGSQAIYGALMQAWADSGAECPPEEAAR